MTEQEIIERIRQKPIQEFMTINERLLFTGLMNEFERAFYFERTKARRILELLNIEKDTIKRFVF